MPKGKVLIAGALGLTGREAVRHFEADGWEVVGLSRRRPEDAYRTFDSKAQYISVDLADKADCEAKLSNLTDITHVVFCAVWEAADQRAAWNEGAFDFVGINVRMLENFLDVTLKASPDIKHMSVFQGAKAYAAHTGGPKIPMKETDPRYIAVSYYPGQEDLLKRRAEGAPWAYTIWRPQFIMGFATGAPISSLPPIGVYAAVCRELGLPLRQPGRPGGLLEIVNTELMAQALVWATDAPTARNETFNITNGDFLRWENVWPRIAELFSIPVAPPHPERLEIVMADKAPVWERIVKKYDLEPYRMDEIVAHWQFADMAFHYSHPDSLSLMSTIKLRQAGFQECADSEDSVVRKLREMQEQRILPK